MDKANKETKEHVEQEAKKDIKREMIRIEKVDAIEAPGYDNIFMFWLA